MRSICRAARLIEVLTSGHALAVFRPLTEAIERVVHHSVILDLMGMDSYRARRATQEAPRRHPTRRNPRPMRLRSGCMTTATTPRRAASVRSGSAVFRSNRLMIGDSVLSSNSAAR